jgi:proline iminopeptidase
MKILLALLALGLSIGMEATDLKTFYPVTPPRQEGYFPVSEKHQIFYALYGNPAGIPLVVLHGGPGMGCSDRFTRFFDLSRFNVVMFDQRGAMRSKPFACMEDNTTQYSIEDIEKLRKYLGIKQWVVFGGSWGSLLATLYGESYPKSCIGFVLTGVFLGREQDIQLFRNKGNAYQEFIRHFSNEEQRDVLAASYIRIMNPDPNVHMIVARAFFRYIMASTMYTENSATVDSFLRDDQVTLSMSRAALHYASHQLFLSPNQVLSRIERISHLPAVIIQGKSDLNCPQEQAQLLHQQWKNSLLWLIDEGGHSGDDPVSIDAVIRATDLFAKGSEISP